MDANDQHLINCIEFIVRRIVREELNEMKQNEIDINDYESDIEYIVQNFIENNMTVDIVEVRAEVSF